MTYPRKSKRSSRNTSTTASSSAIPSPMCCLCQDVVNQEPVYYADPIKQPASSSINMPKTMSAGTTATATSSRSMYSSASSSMMMQMQQEQQEQEQQQQQQSLLSSLSSSCPVTGVYANISEDYYICPTVLGKGHYGIVRECIHRATHQVLAVKSIDKTKIGRLDHLQREIYLLANVDHENIMKMVDCYEDADYVHIITEKYTGGELFDQIVGNTSTYGCFSERKAASVIKSLLEAVGHLHANGVVHRDIKPENILFESKDEDAAVKLIDFGLARRHQKGEAPMTNPVGTAYYMSPELLKGRYNKSCDVWSVGIVAYILLCGYPPFNGSSDSEIQDSTRRGHLRFVGNGWINKSDDAMDFIKCLLRKDPRKRFTANEALMHPWIRKMSMSY